MTAPAVTVTDNPAERRFETTLDGEIAWVNYRLEPGVIVFTHTEVPAAFEGRGVGGALVRAALDAARERGLAVVPLCPFVESYIRRHPEYASLVRS